MDRAQALHALKTRYEIRLRELSDRQNNLILRLNLGSSGANQQTTAAEMELQHALAQHAQLVSTAANARARFELLHAEAKDDPKSATELRNAEREMKLADATGEAIAKRIESIKSVLGDTSIAMTDLIATQEELASARAAMRTVGTELDLISAVSGYVPIEWAQYPSVRVGR
jgi:hypothetical protein